MLLIIELGFLFFWAKLSSGFYFFPFFGDVYKRRLSLRILGGIRGVLWGGGILLLV